MPNDSIRLIGANDPIVDATGLVYRIRRGADRGPLVIMLHGLGGDENVMWIFDRAIPARFTVIGPRAPIKIDPDTPYAEAQGVEGGFSWLRPTPPRSSPSEASGLPEPDQVTFTHSLDLLRRFVVEAIKTYVLDRHNVILMGFSQGAAMGYALSLIDPALIAGVIALAGFMPEFEHPSTPLRSALDARTPRHGYLIIHGVDDQRVPIHYAHQARDYLQSLGARVEYHAYPAGHKISPQGMRDMTQWLNRISDL